MNYWVIGLLIVAFIGDRLMGKIFPKFYHKIQVISLVIISLFMTIHSCVLLYGVYDVLKSDVSTGDKVFFILLVVFVILIYAFTSRYSWCDLLKKKNYNEGIDNSK